MRVLIQWAQRTPRDWVEIDSAAWGTLPDKGDPPPGRMNNPGNQPGWINRLCVQGVHFPHDHYHVRDLPGGSVEVTTWNDDPEDYAPDEFFGAVWIFEPLFQDPRINMGWNTRQSRVIYAAPTVYSRIASYGPIENTTLLPWEEFAAVRPSSTLSRHGVWLPDALYAEHNLALSRTSFRDWVG